MSIIKYELSVNSGQEFMIVGERRKVVFFSKKQKVPDYEGTAET